MLEEILRDTWSEGGFGRTSVSGAYELFPHLHNLRFPEDPCPRFCFQHPGEEVRAQQEVEFRIRYTGPGALHLEFELTFAGHQNPLL